MVVAGLKTAVSRLAPVAALAFAACNGADVTTTPGSTRTPPFGGTIFIDPDIITASDPTTLTSVAPAGTGTRTVFDRRANNWISVNAWLFHAEFSDGLTTEVRVNPEFTAAEAEAEANTYLPAIGRLPRTLRINVFSVTIHKGVHPFGGGNFDLLIHVGQGAQYLATGILEETFVHEAAHASLDSPHATSSGWLAAQAADNGFISTYARDNPLREDIAESVLPWLAVRYRSDRIPAGTKATIEAAIPNRLAYFDGLAMNLSPIQ